MRKEVTKIIKNILEIEKKKRVRKNADKSKLIIIYI